MSMTEDVMSMIDEYKGSKYHKDDLLYLIAKIESCKFECQLGQLVDFITWQQLKAIIEAM